jgi:hypothetical protein
MLSHLGRILPGLILGLFAFLDLIHLGCGILGRVVCLDLGMINRSLLRSFCLLSTHAFLELLHRLDALAMD